MVCKAIDGGWVVRYLRQSHRGFVPLLGPQTAKKAGEQETSDSTRITISSAQLGPGHREARD